MNLTFNRSELIDIEVALKESIQKRKNEIIQSNGVVADGVLDELTSMQEILKKIQQIKI